MTVIDDDWLDCGRYQNPFGRLGDWIPYIPGDVRRQGLQDWQLARPRNIESKDMTIKTQFFYVYQTLMMLTDTLMPITLCMAETEPYIFKKMQKMENNLNAVLQKLPKLTKPNPFAMRENEFRTNLYRDMISVFLSDDLNERRCGKIDPNELRPYLWGFVGICYHHFYDMMRCEKNCADALSGVRKPWNALRASLEAFCTRYGSEGIFGHISAMTLAMREKKYLPKKHGGKKKK